MNERLLDLAVEANDQTGNEFDLNYKKLDAFLEKFAELIVRECMRVVEDYYMDPCSYADEAIKEHFGVEE